MKRYMVQWMFGVILFMAACSFNLSCSKPESGNDPVLAKINNRLVTLSEFSKQLASETEFNPEFKITQKAKEAFLDEIIQREILIQTAKQLKLDEKEKFIHAITHYWEATLIRDLMEMKGVEIRKQVIVSQEEILARYHEMKSANPNLPLLPQIETQISEELKEKKKTRMLTQWMADLKKNTQITINKDLLAAPNVQH